MFLARLRSSSARRGLEGGRDPLRSVRSFPVRRLVESHLGKRAERRRPDRRVGVAGEGKEARRVHPADQCQRVERRRDQLGALLTEQGLEAGSDPGVAGRAEGADRLATDGRLGIVEALEQRLEEPRVGALREGPQGGRPHLHLLVGEGATQPGPRSAVATASEAVDRPDADTRVLGVEALQQYVGVAGVLEPIEPLRRGPANRGVGVLEGRPEHLLDATAVHRMALSAPGPRTLTPTPCYGYGGVRTLAIDHGRRRIGVAMSDPDGTIAQPLETLDGRRLREAVSRIAALVERHGIERIVVGLPVHMKGTEGEEARAARAFGESLARATGVSVEYLDERWTTVEAERVLREAGVPARKQRGRRDRIAAALILRTYLERTRRRERET